MRYKSLFAAFLFSTLTVAHADTSVDTSNEASLACSARPDVGCSGLFPVRTQHKDHPNLAALLTSGEQSLPVRLSSLENAKKSIRIQALIFTGDESGLYISEILKRKKAQGLDVRVIVDALSNLQSGGHAWDGLGWQTQWMYYDLKQHGIEVEGYEAMYLHGINDWSLKDWSVLNKRYHDKMWVIDAETQDALAIVGGLNIANEYFRVESEPERRWRDQDLLVRGPIVQDVATAFDRNYESMKAIKASRGPILNTDQFWKSWRHWIEEFGTSEVSYTVRKPIWEQVAKSAQTSKILEFAEPERIRFIQNRPRLKENYVNQAYLDLIQSAQKELLIANAYFVPEKDLLQALRAASERGVNVKILTNSVETNDLKILAYASRSFYKPLMESDVEVYEWIGPKVGEGTLHAKFAVADGKVSIIGSHNLDSRSKRLNSETVMAIESEFLGGALRSQFLQKDLPLSRAITLEEAIRFHDPKRGSLDDTRLNVTRGLIPML